MTVTSSTPVQYLLDNHYVRGGYTISLGFDKKHKDPSGYWICKICKNRFYGIDSTEMHASDCPVKTKLKNATVYNCKDMIYVCGPKENGLSAPIEIKKIKKFIEKAQLFAERDNLCILHFALLFPLISAL